MKTTHTPHQISTMQARIDYLTQQILFMTNFTYNHALFFSDEELQQHEDRIDDLLAEQQYLASIIANHRNRA